MTILNGNQSRQYKRSTTLNLCFNKYNEVLHEYSPFSDEVDLFTQNNNRLVSLVSGKDVDGKGITIDKDKLKKLFATKCAIICTRTTAYAIKIGDGDLRNAVSRSLSDIYELKETEILGFATRLSETITPLFINDKFNTYAVTKDMLTEVVEMATKFNSSIGQATIVNSDSTYASRVINEVLAAIRTNVRQFNMLINFFEDKHPEFAGAYHIAAAINNEGIHHSGIYGVIKNSATGAFVDDATITLKGKKNTKTTKANDDGAWEIIKFVSGKAKLTISAPGCETQVISVAIIRGKIIELNITLQSQVISLTATA